MKIKPRKSCKMSSQGKLRPLEMSSKEHDTRQIGSKLILKSPKSYHIYIISTQIVAFLPPQSLILILSILQLTYSLLNNQIKFVTIYRILELKCPHNMTILPKIYARIANCFFLLAKNVKYLLIK